MRLRLACNLANVPPRDAHVPRQAGLGLPSGLLERQPRLSQLSGGVGVRAAWDRLRARPSRRAGQGGGRARGVAAALAHACVESKVDHRLRPAGCPWSRPRFLYLSIHLSMWRSVGSSQRQSLPGAAPSFGQPRPASRLGGGSGRPYRACVRQGGMPGSLSAKAKVTVEAPASVAW